MRLRSWVLAAAVSAAGTARAQSLDPLSRTASDITGPVHLAPTRLSIGRVAFPLAVAVHGLKFKDDTGENVQADLYRVTEPADPILRGGNRICGGTGSGPSPVHWVLAWRDRDGTFWLSPSSATEQPTASDATCGTYSYVVK